MIIWFRNFKQFNFDKHLAPWRSGEINIIYIKIKFFRSQLFCSVLAIFMNFVSVLFFNKQLIIRNTPQIIEVWLVTVELETNLMEALISDCQVLW